MTAASEPKSPWRTAGLEWLPVLAGVLSLYVDPLYGIATTLWREEDYAHGPVILVILLWLIWDKRSVLLAPARERQPAWGFFLLMLGLLLFIFGRSQGITFLAIISLIPVLAGTLLALRGRNGLASFWFTLIFIVYLVPLPGSFVGGITGPLKQYISQIAEQILYFGGYPIARSGVTLTIGPYQLLVADACSGINSMFSLSAIGLLYLYVMQRKNWLHIGIVLTSLLPIAFCANVVRVIFLVLLTYHFGDDVGQGFLHGFSGMLLFVVALLLVMTIDSVLARFLKISMPTAVA